MLISCPKNCIRQKPSQVSSPPKVDGGRTAYLSKVCVVPVRRRLGVASRMLAGVVRELPDSCARIRLDASPARESAVRFYASRGFRLTRRTDLLARWHTPLHGTASDEYELDLEEYRQQQQQQESKNWRKKKF